MLLQRLIKDPDIGFNYDYMGAAEYEWGATGVARLAIAKAHMENKMKARSMGFCESIGKNQSQIIQVVALGTEDFLGSFGDVAKIGVTKERFRIESPNIIGWMNIDERNPFMMFRLECDDIQNRINKFMADPLKVLAEKDEAS